MEGLCVCVTEAPGSHGPGSAHAAGDARPSSAGLLPCYPGDKTGSQSYLVAPEQQSLAGAGVVCGSLQRARVELIS